MARCTKTCSINAMKDAIQSTPCQDQELIIRYRIAASICVETTKFTCYKKISQSTLTQTTNLVKLARKIPSSLRRKHQARPFNYKLRNDSYPNLLTCKVTVLRDMTICQARKNIIMSVNAKESRKKTTNHIRIEAIWYSFVYIYIIQRKVRETRQRNY